MHGWLWLLAQLAAAIIMIVALWRLVLPALGRVTEPALLLDVWLPVTLVAPLLTFSLTAARPIDVAANSAAQPAVAGSITGIGWISLGGPIVLATFIIGAALALRQPPDRHPPRGRAAVAGAKGEWPGISDWRLRATLAAVMGGLVLLLLGAAHVLTVWIGNCAFALAAVLLWINTPDMQEDIMADDASDPVVRRAGFGMMVSVCAAIAQASLVIPAARIAPTSAAAIALGSAALGSALVVRAARNAEAVRIGLWTGGLGVLFALGMLSLGVLLPRAIRAIQLEADPGPPVVAHGFGAYAFEAVILILLPIALPALRMHRSARMYAGLTLLSVGGLVVGWRGVLLLVRGF